VSTSEQLRCASGHILHACPTRRRRHVARRWLTHRAGARHSALAATDVSPRTMLLWINGGVDSVSRLPDKRRDLLLVLTARALVHTELERVERSGEQPVVATDDTGEMAWHKLAAAASALQRAWTRA
jgi:hypothetical protein